MSATAELTRPGPALISAAYAEHGKALFRFALDKTSGDRQQAEDVVQETMIRLWNHGDRFDVDRAMRPWLFTVAKRIAIDRHRHRSARLAEVDAAELDDVPALDELDRRLTGHVVAQAVRTLPPQHRDVIRAIYFRDMKIIDVAELLGLPIGTIKSRIYYALRSLRETLEKRGVTSTF